MIHRLYCILFLNLSAFASTLCATDVGVENAREQSLKSHVLYALLSVRDQDKKAIEVCETTFQLNPSSLYLLQKRVDQHRSKGDLKAASQLFRHYLEQHPDNTLAALAYIQFLRSSSPHDSLAQKQAIETSQNILKRDPDHEIATLELLSLYEESSQPDKAMKVFETLKSKGNLPFSQAHRLIRSLAPRGEVDTLLNALADEASQKTQTHPNEAYKLSEHYRAARQLDRARSILEAHCEATPSSLKMKIRLGILHFIAEEEEKAISVLKNVIEIDPRQSKAHRMLSKHYLKTDQLTLALPHRHAVLAHSGGTAEEFAAVADAYAKNGQTELSLALLRDARFYHPQSVPAAMALAQGLMNNGQASQANRLYREAEVLAKDSIYPEDEALLDSTFQLDFAKTLVESGAYTDAESRLRLALKSFTPEQNQESADALTLLAKLWIDQDKNISAAKSLLRRAQQLLPNHLASKKLLETLQLK